MWPRPTQLSGGSSIQLLQSIYVVADLHWYIIEGGGQNGVKSDKIMYMFQNAKRLYTHLNCVPRGPTCVSNPCGKSSVK